jgi:hypothetical protein
MSITAAESPHPLGESQTNERKERLVHLTWIIFNLMAERHLGEMNHEFDGVEDASLIDALRVCAYYSNQIGCSDFGDTLVVHVKGIDGHEYIIQFSLLEPRHSILVARVHITKLPMAGREDQVESSYNRMNVLQQRSKRLKFSGLTTDRVFLIGMSLVISFMDDEDDGSDEEDARLAPLSALVRPTDEELREIWAKKLPPSTINYDDEVDMPY